MLYSIVYQIGDGLGGYYRANSLQIESEGTVSENQAKVAIEEHETAHAPNLNWTRNLSRRIKIVAIEEHVNEEMVLCHWCGREIAGIDADLIGVTTDDEDMYWCGCEQEEQEA